jgi:hypothetical protein
MFLDMLFTTMSLKHFHAENFEKTKPFGRSSLLHINVRQNPFLKYCLFSNVLFHIFNFKDNECKGSWKHFFLMLKYDKR